MPVHAVLQYLTVSYLWQLENKGQNARLAAKLTGWKIDIKPESGFYGEEPEEVYTVQEEAVETTEEA